MGAIERGDEIERRVQRRIREAYAAALKTAMKNLASFKREMERVESGEKAPPSYYDTPEKVAKWKAGYWQELVRRYRVQETLMTVLNQAGETSADIIREEMPEVYTENLAEVRQMIEKAGEKIGRNVTFDLPSRREVEITITQEGGAFSKLAFRHLGQNEVIRHRLQGEMAQACILGENQKKLMNRIRRITGQSEYQARRVAQTERNRVQSQARFDAATEAAEMGIDTYSEWRCRFVRSREAHMQRHGQRVRTGDVFPGSVMHYPGDPAGSAKEVCNCHCYLQVGVLLPDETLNEDGEIVKVSE